MPISSSFKKWTTGLGALTGAALFYWNIHGNKEFVQVHNSWTTNAKPSVKWDHNWDRLYSLSFLSLLLIKNINEFMQFNIDM